MAKKQEVVELGDKAQDAVTGLTGIVTSTSKNLFGCNRAYVQPQADKNQKIADGFWCDVDSLKVLKKSVVKGHAEIPELAKTGGPMSRVR